MSRRLARNRRRGKRALGASRRLARSGGTLRAGSRQLAGRRGSGRRRLGLCRRHTRLRRLDLLRGRSRWDRGCRSGWRLLGRRLDLLCGRLGLLCRRRGLYRGSRRLQLLHGRLGRRLGLLRGGSRLHGRRRLDLLCGRRQLGGRLDLLCGRRRLCRAWLAGSNGRRLRHRLGWSLRQRGLSRCRRRLHGTLGRFGPRGWRLGLPRTVWRGCLRQLAPLRSCGSLRRRCTLFRRSLTRPTSAGRRRSARGSLGASALRAIRFFGRLLLLCQKHLLARLERRRVARRRQQHERRNNRAREEECFGRRSLRHGHPQSEGLKRSR